MTLIKDTKPGSSVRSQNAGLKWVHAVSTGSKRGCGFGSRVSLCVLPVLARIPSVCSFNFNNNWLSVWIWMVACLRCSNPMTRKFSQNFNVAIKWKHLKKNSEIWLKSVDALTRWFFRCIHIEVHCSSVMETHFHISSLQVKFTSYVWTEEETEYVLQVIREKNIAFVILGNSGLTPFNDNTYWLQWDCRNFFENVTYFFSKS